MDLPLNKPVCILVLGGGDRGYTYSCYSLKKPKEMIIAGVAEPVEVKRKKFINDFGLSKEKVFKNFEEALREDKFADAVLICTPDNSHFKAAKAALEKGYDILIEKPICNNKKDIINLVRLNKKYKKIIGVCHVLRYTKFFKKIKQIAESGALGEIITIELTEPVGFWHTAHSYVRGNWKDSNISGPMILTKSCHDMDILRWIADSKCKKISSFGRLKHFNHGNAPHGSTFRCTDGCKVERECPYSAKKIYLNMKTKGWPVSVITADLTYSGRLKAIKETDYGICVYRSNNNVVDNQVSILEFENGINASFVMAGFTHNISERRIRVMGSKGELICDSKTMQVYNFLSGKVSNFKFSDKDDKTQNRHFGGDDNLISDFLKAVKYQDIKYLSSDLETSVESHIMAFNAEKSRISGKTVII